MHVESSTDHLICRDTRDGTESIKPNDECIYSFTVYIELGVDICSCFLLLRTYRFNKTSVNIILLVFSVGFSVFTAVLYACTENHDNVGIMIIVHTVPSLAPTQTNTSTSLNWAVVKASPGGCLCLGVLLSALLYYSGPHSFSTSPHYFFFAAHH